MTREEKRQFWQAHMTDWKQSQQSQSAYCETHHLKLATFGYWRTRLSRLRLAKQTKERDQGSFLPVQRITRPPADSGESAIIRYGALSISLPVQQLNHLLPLFQGLIQERP